MKLNDKLTHRGGLDRTLLALADPTRRAILRRLIRKGETRVTELARPFAISLNAVSKHIRALEQAKLVRRRRVWREHLVSFNPAPLDGVVRWVEQTRGLSAGRPDAGERMFKQKDKTKPTGKSTSKQPKSKR
jgi:DNA-binding transcriptional ArsR family regulator